ncbi:tetratricopeptide repeat protein [Flavobacterium sp.]|uniref:tetratricopeptide repeat protein n=1 Tax=Flavobacterium sp. TaxID=239 RepID=UPI003753857D
MKRTLSLVILFLSNTVLFSQSTEGYWDNIRTTTETITLRAGEKKFIKTADFPTGTTEVVYRITLLDDNQKLSSSLVSVLKAIPDPTGISQGTAGAVFLLSTISGDDKCKYSIYTSNSDAENYIKTNKTTNACFVQNTSINKEAKLIASNSDCLSSKTQNLFFAFESDNYLLKQKIIIEVVPWINKKLSRGWNSDNKKEIVNLTKTFKVYSKITKKEQFSSDFMEQITQKYTYKEYSNLLAEEKKLLNELFTEQSLKKTGEINMYYDLFREASANAFKNENLEKAFTIIQTEIIDKNRAKALDYATIGAYYLISKQFDKAEKSFLKGIALDASETILQLQLAHLYLFTDKVTEAKELHKKYKNQNISAKISWIEQTKTDFELFKKYKLSETNFKKILRILE